MDEQVELEYTPLTPETLEGMSDEAQEGVLRVRMESTQNQMFRNVRVEYTLTEDGETIIGKTHIPESLPTDTEWEVYLDARAMYHKKAAENATSRFDTEASIRHEQMAMRAAIAARTLRNENNSPNLVVAAARGVLIREQADYDEGEAVGQLKNIKALREARIEYAGRMVSAMEERFSE